MTAGRPGRRRVGLPGGVGVWCFLVVLGAWVGLSVWRPWDPVPDPYWEGARISIWFRRLAWTSEGRWDDAVARRYLEAKLALLRAGTNAVPCLVTRALAPDRDSQFRRAARALFPGRFGAPGRPAAEALEFLELLRPRVGQVKPWLPDLREAEGDRRNRALRILARTRRAPAEEERLLRELVDSRGLDVATTEDLLRSSSGVPNLRATDLTAGLATASTRAAALGLLSRMGPAGGAAIPALEALLVDTNELTRLRSAFVLLEVSNGHPAARDLVSSWGASRSFSHWNGVTNPTAIAIFRDAGSLLRISRPEGVEAIERWAAEEIAGWEKRGLEETASGALERVAPERAIPLYAAQVAVETNRTNVRIVAARGWLRLQRTNEVPFRFLISRLEGNDSLPRMAAEALKEADEERVPGGSRLGELSKSATEPAVRSSLENSRLEMAIRRAVERLRAAESP